MRITSTARIRLAAAAAPVLMLTGCLQMEHDLRIHADGSALYRLDYAITEQAITQFRAMFKLKDELAIAAGEPPPGPELEPLLFTMLDPNEADIRRHLAEVTAMGITIRSIRHETRAAWRHLEIQLEIADLALLADHPFFKAHGFDLFKNAEGHYVFNRQPHLDEPAHLAIAPSARDLEQITPLLAGFKTVVKVTPPGRILSSTAARTSLQTAFWEFDFNRQPAALTSLLHQHFHLIFDAPRATLPVLRHTPGPLPTPP